jgi:hypothetical protein
MAMSMSDEEKKLRELAAAMRSLGVSKFRHGAIELELDILAGPSAEDPPMAGVPTPNTPERDYVPTVGKFQD